MLSVSLPCNVHVLSFDHLYQRLQQHRQRIAPAAEPTAAEGDKAPLLFEPKLWRESRALAYKLSLAIVQSAQTPSHSPSSPTSAAVLTPSRHLLLLDDNFSLRSMRHRFCSLTREHRIGFMQWFVPCSLDEALRRNERRNNSSVQKRREIPLSVADEAILERILREEYSGSDLPSASALGTHKDEDSKEEDQRAEEAEEVTEATIRKMHASFEPPPLGLLEQKETTRNWERFSYEVTSNVQGASSSTSPSAAAASPSSSFDIPWASLRSAFGSLHSFVPLPLLDPVAEAARIERARKETHSSLLHQLDLQSRKIIQDRVAELQEQRKRQEAQAQASSKEKPKESVQQAAGRWNQQRKTLLSEAKKNGSAVHATIQAAAASCSASASSSSPPDHESASHSHELDAVLKAFQSSLTIDE